jgi:hypothetical protein
MPATQPGGYTRYVDQARHAARRAAIDLATRHGARQVTRLAREGAAPAGRDVEPVAGLLAAREIELAARHVIKDYIRGAREAGYSWRYIGGVLNAAPEDGQGLPGNGATDAAFGYAAGPPDSPAGRAFSWECGSCQRPVTDRGPGGHPADTERGHAGSCDRLQAAVAAWDASCEAGR